MTNSLDEIRDVLDRTLPVDGTTSPATLREWRAELVHTSVFVSYAISVLSLDLEVLQRSLDRPEVNILQTLVDELPSMLTESWVGGGWSLSPDASASVAAAAELSLHQSQGLLGVHAAIYEGDLSDVEFVKSMQTRIEEQRRTLWEYRDQLEERIRSIQRVIKDLYASGVASVNDWFE